MSTKPQTAELTAVVSSFEARRLRMGVGCAFVGVLLVYLAGFAQMEPLHNGAHDARHAAALPCH